MLINISKYSKENENFIATLMIFFSQPKTFMENSIPKIKLSKVPLLNFLAKFLTERKSLKNKFTIVRLKFLYRKLHNL